MIRCEERQENELEDSGNEWNFAAAAVGVGARGRGRILSLGLTRDLGSKRIPRLNADGFS